MLHEFSNELAALVDSTAHSIVRVEARRRLPATGVVWSADGLIVTANHVVEMDEGIQVALNDGSSHAATVVGRDPSSDIAVLRVNGSLTAATWAADDALKVGHLVLALGRPGKQVQASLGVVSAFGERKVRAGGAGRDEERGRRGGRRRWSEEAWWMSMPFGEQTESFIQTDVTMYPGFSGGPLIGGDGAVGGINSSGFMRGISLTIPAATVRRVVETLVKHGKMRRGYLGVGAQPARLPEALAKQLEQEVGLLVVSVESGSPAEAGGLYLGDVIVALDGEPTESLEELLALLGGGRVGMALPVRVVRAGQVHDVQVTIGERA